MKAHLTPEQRFWSKVDPCRTDGCALWIASTRNGYGSFFWNGRTGFAHHFLVGRPPLGLMWDHVKKRGCTHRNCVWPEHLELVTNRENARRGDTGIHQRSRTHCPRGHAYDETNTYHKPSGRRECFTCRHEESSQRALARKLARAAAKELS